MTAEDVGVTINLTLGLAGMIFFIGTLFGICIAASLDYLSTKGKKDGDERE